VAAWGSGPFDNDEAMDFVVDLVKAFDDERADQVRAALDLPDRLEQPQALRAVAAAALVATRSARGDGDGDGGDAATEPPYVTQLAHADGIPVDDGTLEQARDALARVLKSEDEWRGSYGDLLVSNVRETVEELRGRL
jgi:hypothetical protein